jgi:hypothetical protein
VVTAELPAAARALKVYDCGSIDRGRGRSRTYSSTSSPNPGESEKQKTNITCHYGSYRELGTILIGPCIRTSPINRTRNKE